MSDFGMKEEETSLVPVAPVNGEDKSANDYVAGIQTQMQDYGQKFNDAAAKAKDFATEKFNQANEKLKDFQSKDFTQITEDAKDFAKKNPGQTILISAAVGLVLGLLLRPRR